ncbi:RHS repeat-associated core domain-containing protein [Actinoallomurus iriomotensis]|uniref:Type IV secretion protein Rhs n=1 Tax=Actinoallomurus iriomotensis TaxID=478107 RepID=A0A9W6W1L3_9ACTN|nr:RHS repeat-associated core domain-containing protein [Actinoallomurus iriomotensis]GLY86076.1 type IV secretion protein Rhs [Actinoallomurus iriomotensis]
MALAMLAPLLAATPFVFDSGGPAALTTPAAHGVHKAHYAKQPKPHDAAAKNAKVGPNKLPSGGSGVVAFDRKHLGQTGRALAKVTAHGTPVWAQPVVPPNGSYRGPSQVAVKVADRGTAAAAGVDGVLFSARAVGGTGLVNLGVDYRKFTAAYGGNYGSRLRLATMPACALTSPQTPVCRVQTPLPQTHNAAQARTVYAQVNAGVQPIVLAADTGGSPDGGNDGGSPAGTYSATSLKPSGSWSAGGSAGSFTYSYPIQPPPAASALVPTLGLSYDSGSVDGQTSATQAQASWLGDGWGTPQSYVEQSFKPCSDSPEGSAAPKSTADECYDGPILTLSLNGSSSSLVWDADKKTYTPSDDNGEVVKHVTGSNNGSGTHDTDYWQVTDKTGTVFQFGRNELPGWSSGSPTTNSVDSEPVFSAHSGDPCYDSTWSSSWCTMAYRWNLDYVKDVHGNGMAYYYKQDTNAYARNADTSGTTTPKANSTYVRDSHLDHIDYGFTDGNAYTVNGGHAPDQVQFTTGDRCLSGTCDPLNKTNAANWPDVPYDLNCTNGSDCLVVAPSFWSTVRLTGITTQQWNGTKYAPVDSWAFTQTLPATGDGTSPTLWLSKISHTGADTTAGGSAVTLPDVSFTAKAMANRLDTVTDGLPALTRMRVSSVTTETGSVIKVDYTLTDPCSASAKPTAASNTSSCYPVYWTPQDDTKPLLDWFDKYQVHSVTQSDPYGGAPEMYTEYKYLDGGAWHYDDNELVKAKYRTYGQWRGYGRVQTFTGKDSDPQTENEATFYRGMSKDNDTTKVTLTDSQGGTHEDIDELAGETLETTNYNYSGGPVIGSTINSYWVSPATAARSRTGLPDLTANATGQVETWARQALTSGSTTTWRKTETDTSYGTDSSSPTFGLPLVVYTHGDLSQPDQRQCAITTYAPANTTLNLAGLPAEVETDAGACGGTNPEGSSAPTTAQTNALTAPTGVSRPADVVSDQRTFYDDPTLAATWPQPSTPAWPQAAPTKGDISVIRVASDYTGGAFSYQTKSASVYDSYGRVTDAYDALGHKTHTGYTMANGVTTATNVSNPLGQATSTTLDPLRGLPTSATDPNQITAATHYDGLGRLTDVWQAGRSTSSPANLHYAYQVSNTGPTVVTTQKLNDASGLITSTALYDALLRPRQSQDPTPQGGRLITDTFYDSHGWTWKKNNPTYDPDSTPNSTLASVPDSQVDNQDVTAFDGAGRPVLATSYQRKTIKSQVASAYNLAMAGDGDATVTVPLDASSRPFTGATAKISVQDALGRITEQDEYTTAPSVAIDNGQGTAPITTVAISGGSTTASNGNPQATQYVFDKTGHQTDVKSLATSDDWKTGYNLLGEATSKTDPDAGTSTIAYDPAGNITQTTDARGKTISFTYDGLNRKTGQYAATVSSQSPANQMASWVYDNSDNAIAGMADPIGHLTSSASYIGGSGTGGHAYKHQIGGYNALGEPTSETITIPADENQLANSYAITHTYEPITGLPRRDIYPANGTLPAETVSYDYKSALDVPSDLTSNLTTYTDDVTWTALGQVGQTKLGNTINNAQVINTYDPHTGELTDTQLTNTAVSSTPIDKNTYTYDPVGNPTSQTETRQNGATETQCFDYDTLDRLVQAWTATDACAADPTSNNGATVGSGITNGAYWTNWTFDPLGERKTQTEHNLTGPGDAVTTYTYDGNGANQPHTLTKASTTNPSGTSTSTFSYDKNGNTLQRTTPGQGQQSLSWDDSGQLIAVTGSSNGSSYIYDADGTLLLQKDPGTTTLYLPGEQLALDTTSGQITGTRFYSLPGGGEAIRTGSGTAYSFEIGDQHGTGTLALNSTLTTPTWRQQTPYGAPRGTTTTSWPDNHGFLNKVQDTTTGLTDVGARWYDPDTGTFASLDPLFEATDSQQQAGYNYAGSNPITSSDPTGLNGCTRDDGPGCRWGDKTGKNHNGTGVTGGNKDYCSHFNCNPQVMPDAAYSSSTPLDKVVAAEEAARRAALEAAQKRMKLQHQIAALLAKIKLCSNTALVGAMARSGHPASCGNGSGAAGLLKAGLYLSAAATALLGCADAPADLVTCGPALEGGASLAGCATSVNLCSLEGGGGAEGGLADEEAALRSELSALCGGKNSFAGDTKVLLANGTSKPIAEVKVGDKVANTRPGAGPGMSKRAHRVTAVHVTHTDHDYTDITVATSTGTHAITSTAHHLYWDVTTRAWTRADHLHAGDRLQTSGHSRAVIVAIRSYTASMVTYNLTIDRIHTYYVEAGTTPVLVHNSGCSTFMKMYGGGGGVMAELNNGAMSMAVERGGSSVSGGQMFADAMNHFGPENVTSFEAKWVPAMPTNLDAFNANLRAGMSFEEAAANTFTGHMAGKYGLTSVAVDRSRLVGRFGHYTNVEPVFSRPIG